MARLVAVVRLVLETSAVTKSGGSAGDGGMGGKWLAGGVIAATDAAWQRICRVSFVGRVASESAAGSAAVVVVVACWPAVTRL